MGRPLNKRFFGDPSSVGNQFNVEAWIPGGSGVVSAWILLQKTNNTYLVTDGADTGRCRLQEGTITGPGQMRMSAMPFGFDIATATATMKAILFPGIAVEGTGYNPGETITLTGGTASTDVVLTVNRVRTNGIATVDPGTGSTPFDNLTVVGGTPLTSAATVIVLSCKAVSVAVSADGEGYIPGEIITLAGGTFFSAATVEVTSVGTWIAGLGDAGSGYSVGNVVTVTGGTGTAPTFNITSTKAVSATVADEGNGYSVVDTLTLVGGSFGIAAIFDIDTVGTVIGQNELDFDGTGSNGTFVGGDGVGAGVYVALDVLTMSDGSTIRVDTIDGNGDVVTFTILTASTSGQAADGATLTQTGLAGTGTDTTFTLTLGVANQSVFAVSVNTVGAYSAEPVNDVTTSSSGSGTFAKLTVLYGALITTIAGIGDLTVIPSNPASTTGPGSGLTMNLTYKIVAVALDGSGSIYTVLPSNPVAQGSTTGVGSEGTFTMDWGVDTVTIGVSLYTATPTDPVSTTGGGGDATFDIDWGVNVASITTPGDYTVVPSDPVFQGSTSGTGTGAKFLIEWGVLAVVITDDGGGYVSAPTVTFSGGGGSGAGATSTLTTVGGPTPPNEAVANIAVIFDGEGYSSVPSVTIAAPVGDVEYVRILNAHQVKTFNGNVYSWSQFLADEFDEADLDLS